MMVSSLQAVDPGAAQTVELQRLHRPAAQTYLLSVLSAELQLKIDSSDNRHWCRVDTPSPQAHDGSSYPCAPTSLVLALLRKVWVPSPSDRNPIPSITTIDHRRSRALSKYSLFRKLVGNRRRCF